MMIDVSVLLENALSVVKSAGEIIIEHNLQPHNIMHKGRIDLVTETDVAVEAFLKEKLSALYPEATFMAEESYTGLGLRAESSSGKAIWIIDPLDGTTNFAHQIPFIATSVALWQGNKPLLAIVNAPLLGESFWAVHGGGAFCNGKKISVSSTKRMQDALVATGFPYDIESHADKLSLILNRVLKNARGVRRCGAAALDLAYLAAGRYDIFYENGLKAWDSAAGILLIEEACGVVSNYSGAAYAPGDAELLAASSRDLHNLMCELLNS